MINKIYLFREDLKKRLKNKDFQKAWKKTEVEYELGKKLIAKRLDRKMSQRDLAKKAHTTQAVVSRIESMNANPSLNLLKKLAVALQTKLIIRFT